MAKRKAVFFDIDNTIWDFHNVIPESTVRAIRALRRNGHLALLCSGRTRGFIRDPALLNIGFDGIISGCGTLLEFDGKTLFYYSVSKDMALRTLKTVQNYGFRSILEGREHLYLNPEDFANDLYGEKLRRDMGEHLFNISDHWGEWEFSKFSCDTRGCDQAAGVAALSEDYDAIIHNENVVEFVPKGFDKGTGIQRLCELIGQDLDNTVAFGDSVNDLGMFAVCGTSVCMGNGVDAAKLAADMVTSALDDNGIWNGCLRLGLIGEEDAV